MSNNAFTPLIALFAFFLGCFVALASEFNLPMLASWDQNFSLKVAILVMGTILCIAAMLAKKKGWGKYSVRPIALILIITAALFIMTCNNCNGESPQDTAPLWGLLGAIAGYVLGENGTDEEMEKKNELEKE